MRLWSLHPQYLDRQGLLACWREALLAQKVLEGGTKGYKNHPQLERFKQFKNSLDYIGAYLLPIWFEANSRGYNFESAKILRHNVLSLPVTQGQVNFEFGHLQNKLWLRDRKQWCINSKESERFSIHVTVVDIKIHPMFYLVKGEKESWERG